MNKPLTAFLAVLLILVTAAACASNGPQPDAEASAEATPPATETTAEASAPPPTETPAPSATSAPTDTPLPTGTSFPTETSTPTPEPTAAGPPQALFVSQYARVLAGPGDAYPEIGVLGEGMVLDILAQSADGLWLVVDLGLGQSGWMLADRVLYQADALDVEVAAVPPTPTPPPAYFVYWFEINQRDEAFAIWLEFINFRPGEKVQIQFARSTNGNIDRQYETTTFSGQRNTMRIETTHYLYHGIAYLVTATGDMGSSYATTIVIP